MDFDYLSVTCGASSPIIGEPRKVDSMLASPSQRRGGCEADGEVDHSSGLSRTAENLHMLQGVFVSAFNFGKL